MPQSLEIELIGDQATESTLASLRDWLKGEEILGLRVEAIHAPPAPDHMGVDPLMALSVILGSRAAVELFKSLTAWIEHRKPHLKLKIKTAAGTVEIDAQNVDNLEAAVKRALDLLETER